MRFHRFCILAALTFSSCLPAQENHAKSIGGCSPVAAGNNNVIVVKASQCGLSRKQFEEIKTILGRILNKEVDPSELLVVLKDLKDGQLRIEDGVVKLSEQMAQSKKRYTRNGEIRIDSRPGQTSFGAGEMVADTEIQDAWAAHKFGKIPMLAHDALKRSPDWPMGYYYLGTLAIMNKNYAEARSNFEIFLAKTTDDQDYDDVVQEVQQRLLKITTTGPLK